MRGIPKQLRTEVDRQMAVRGAEKLFNRKADPDANLSPKAFLKKKVVKPVINATANVLSAPAQIKSALARRRSAIDTIRLKNARGAKGAPRFNEDGSVSDAYKAKFLADEVRYRLTKKKKK